MLRFRSDLLFGLFVWLCGLFCLCFWCFCLCWLLFTWLVGDSASFAFVVCGLVCLLVC